MLTRKQHELLCFIHDRLGETGVSPSFEEMKDALDLKSKSGVHRLISALEERGFIRRLPNRARALEVLRMPDKGGNVVPLKAPALPAAANDIVELPLHGRIAAGTPIEALQGNESLAVPAALLGPGEHYALEVSGDSMVEAGIFDGDFALVRRASTARAPAIPSSGPRSASPHWEAEARGPMATEIPSTARTATAPMAMLATMTRSESPTEMRFTARW